VNFDISVFDRRHTLKKFLDSQLFPEVNKRTLLTAFCVLPLLRNGYGEVSDSIVTFVCNVAALYKVSSHVSFTHTRKS
jgi:hypothetical protein